MELSVVVPCFNEAARLPASIASAKAYLTASGREFELILVDDGSRDRTADVIAAAARADGAIRAVTLGRNRGKGRALAEGVTQSRGRLVLVSDADFSSPIDELGKLERALDDGADVAIGSRAAPGTREVDQPVHRRLVGRAFNAAVRTVLLPDLRDTQCGFKLFRGDVARDLFGRLATDGFAFDVEILYRARRGGYRVSEVPVRWINSADTRVRVFRHSSEMLVDLVRIRLGR